MWYSGGVVDIAFTWELVRRAFDATISMFGTTLLAKSCDVGIPFFGFLYSLAKEFRAMKGAPRLSMSGIRSALAGRLALANLVWVVWIVAFFYNLIFAIPREIYTASASSPCLNRPISARMAG